VSLYDFLEDPTAFLTDSNSWKAGKKKRSVEMKAPMAPAAMRRIEENQRRSRPAGHLPAMTAAAVTMTLRSNMTALSLSMPKAREMWGFSRTVKASPTLMLSEPDREKLMKTMIPMARLPTAAARAVRRAGAPAPIAKAARSGMMRRARSMRVDWCVAEAEFLLFEEGGEVDDDEDAEAEGDAVALEIAGLDTAEEVSCSTSEAREATDEDSVDEELIDEVDDGGEDVLANSDDALVDFIDAEAIGEELREAVVGEFVFVFTPVEDEGGDCSDDEGYERGDKLWAHMDGMIMEVRSQLISDGLKSTADGQNGE